MKIQKNAHFPSIGLIGLLYLSSSLNVFGQTALLAPKNDKYLLNTTSGPYELPLFNITQLKAIEQAPKFEGKYFVLIQFYDLPTLDQRNLWSEKGLELVDYFPNNAYFATLSSDFPLLSIQSHIRSVQLVDSKLKKESNLYINGVPEASINNDGTVNVIISYYNGLSFEAIKKHLLQNKVTINQHLSYSRQIYTSVPLNEIDNVVNFPYVQFLGLEESTPKPEVEEFNNTTGRSNYLNTNFEGRNFNGEGVTFAIDESGTVDNIIDLKGRLIEASTTTPSSHKIGVIRYAGGSGNTDPSNRNNAWGATILSANTANYVDYYTSHKALYTNHSYGWNVSGGYNSGSRSHDLRYETYPIISVIYSAGNSGADTGYAPYRFPLWANITGATKQSKNQYTIGSLNPLDKVGGGSSKGPYYDGRIGPTLIIEGAGGTSNAAPKVAGLLAILTQIYKQKFNNAIPPSTLLKGILMNTADEVEKPGPDFRSGYGRPNMKRAYSVLNNNQFLTDNISSTNNSKTHTITVPANTKQLRVMIAWPDKAASINASVALVNNLNLVGKSPTNTTFLPWILNHTPDTALMNAPATRGIDNLNPMEQITVDNPQAGNWTFTVTGGSVPLGPQIYFLNYEFLNEELAMAYPLANEKFIAGEVYRLRWDSYGNSGMFDLEYELDGNNNWISIANNIEENTRVYEWTAPLSLNKGIKNIRFRVKKGSSIGTSGNNQIGPLADNFKITKICNNQVHFSWTAIPNATSYTIYKLGAKYMEPVTSNIVFNGNTAILSNQSNTTSEYYAISGLTNSLEGSRSFAIEKVLGDYLCNGINWIGTVSSNWFDPNNWASNQIPTAKDKIIIPAGAPFYPIINDTGALCGSLTINQGATLSMDPTNEYTLELYDTWENNGTFKSGNGIISFVGESNYREIRGNSTTDFNKLQLNVGNMNRMLEVKSLITLNAPSNPLILTSGMFKLSSASTIAPFHTQQGGELYSYRGFWNNGGTVNFGNFNLFINGGTLRNTAGQMNIGSNNSSVIVYLNKAKFIIEGGNVIMAGKMRPYDANAAIYYTQTDGTLEVNSASGGSNNNHSSFHINTASKFDMSNGTILIHKSNNSPVDFFIDNTNSRMSGGLIQLGSTKTLNVNLLKVKSKIPIHNILINLYNNANAQILDYPLSVTNNFTIERGTFNLNNQSLTIGGDLTNNATIQALNTAELIFAGNRPQVLTSNTNLNISQLTLDNPLGLSLQGTNTLYTIARELKFINGQINATNKVITFIDDATATGHNSNKFINGTINKIGNDAFTFPIGKNGIYAPIAISAPSQTTDAFAAQYSPANANPLYPINALTSPLTSISDVEYWNLDRINGNSAVNVSLSWEATRSGNVNNNNSTHVSRWNGTSWVSEGRSNATTNGTQGVVTSNAVQNFSPFTFGSTSVPLPIILKHFDARKEQENVVLEWELSSIDQLSKIELEKSENATDWNILKTFNDANTIEQTHKYETIDVNPNEGVNYYRIKMIEESGNSIYSNIKKVTFDTIDHDKFFVYPNPAQNELYILSDAKEYTVEIINTLGKRMIHSDNVSYIDISKLTSGNYFIKINYNGNTINKKLAIIK